MRAPNDDYYRVCEGSWRSRLDFRITDWRTFWRCPMGWLDRLRVLSIVLWPRWLGRYYLDTTVARDGDEVVHTTRASLFGVAFMSSREIISLDSDGRGIVLSGEQKLWPTPWKKRPFEATGEVDETGSRASYVFANWFGTELRQSTVAEEELVVVTQRTDWSEGVQHLRRR